MDGLKKINFTTRLTLLTIDLAALQSYLDHIGMSCFAHPRQYIIGVIKVLRFAIAIIYRPRKTLSFEHILQVSGWHCFHSFRQSGD